MNPENSSVKELKGYSGSKVLLIGQDDHFFVRKYGQNNRNIERLTELESKNIRVPKIINVQNDYYDMEYIPNLDIKTYLTKNPTNNLVDFLLSTICKFKDIVIEERDFTDTFNTKLANCDFSLLPFSKDELISKLPKVLPVTTYHGDFTLENILYNTKTDSFFLIDPLTTEYNSYVFDLAKLKQDVICQWFIRHDDFFLNTKLNVIDNALSKFDYYDNDYLLILMLLRVLPYTKTTLDRDFILEWITKLWK
jgi:tRNA A-37 threonylcarbamoyl transferase component Bud32